MHTIWVITRLAKNARRTDRASVLISCEHCRSSRNNSHYAPRHVIYYYRNGIRALPERWVKVVANDGQYFE